MYEVTLRFFEGLNYFLPKGIKNRIFTKKFPVRRSIKDLIESLGIPHVEVDLIKVNGEFVGFSYIVQDHDRIEVYPDSQGISVDKGKKLRDLHSGEIKFVCDVHLWKLARRLRLLGFDVNYENFREDDELAEIAEKGQYIMLSRDRQLFMRSSIKRGFFIKSMDPDEQVVEVLKGMDIKDKCSPFSRCISCNGTLDDLKTGTEEFELHRKKIPLGILNWCKEFKICRSCRKVFWKGSHYKKLKGTVVAFLTL